MFSSNYQPSYIICSQWAQERPTDPDVITHYASSRPTYHSVPIPCCLEIRAMLVTSYSTHAPVNLWCEHVLFWGNDMEAKTTRGYRLSLQTVRLQSPVSNLNLLCHLKSPWTNLTLACNNRLEECLSVVCVWVSVWPQAYLLWSWHWKIMTTHTHTHTYTQEINQNYMQHRVCITPKSM